MTFHEEQGGQPWARKLKDLLLEMKGQVEEAKAAGQAKLGVSILRNLKEQYEEILAEGLALNPPAGPRAPGQRGRLKQSKARNLLERLRDRREPALAFLYDFRVPFENSQAERDLRMMKVKQKISGCFRSSHGAAAFCRIRGYLSTLQKQGHPMLVRLRRTRFQGQSFDSKPYG
ncbi:MAG: transposase [Chloroflexi bacterium]|nr:transposase [Chloroflexota bacterium]